MIEIRKKRQELAQQHFRYGQVPRDWLPELPEDPKIQKQLKKKRNFDICCSKRVTENKNIDVYKKYVKTIKRCKNYKS